MSGLLQLLLALSNGTNVPTFRAMGSVGTGVNPTAGVPAGVVAGDLLVLLYTSSQSISDPAGWSIAKTPNGTNPQLGMWYKVATGSDSAVNVTSSGTSSHLVMLAYKFVNATPLNTNGTLNSTTSTSASTNSLTTTVANCVVISAFAANLNAGTWSAIPGSPVNTIYNGGGLTGIKPLLILDEIKTAAGATTSRSATISSSVPWQTFASSFKP